MSEQLIVNVSAFETRVAVMTGTQVSEVLIERRKDRGIVGNIYLGKVQRVLPGMQAAFVEIGLDKAAFLYVGDVLVQQERTDAEGNTRITKRRAHKDAKIDELLKAGQSVMVQVAKDAIGTKGPRVTCSLSLPGRHLVYMPGHDHIGVSRRIVDEDERARLKTTLLEAQAKYDGGYVVRTVSEGLSEDKLKEDAAFLAELWRDIDERRKQVAAPALVQEELDLVMRACRDMFTDQTHRVIIDDPATTKQAQHFMTLRDKSLVSRIEPFEQDEPIFEHYGIESELARAMSRKVWLRSGGYLVIDQAEALTAIDVNTGRFVGKRNLEETILKTNLEAITVVAEQLRLRNIGGMVIIDFIDMEDQPHRDRVLTGLEEALQADRARCNVVKMSPLGLVEMTRQRTRESLGRQTTETCWYCEGRGVLKSKETIVYDVFRALLREGPRFFEEVIVVQTHPEVADVMYDAEADVLTNIEERIGKRVVVRPRGSFHQEQFDIFGTSEEAAPAPYTGSKRKRKRA